MVEPRSQAISRREAEVLVLVRQHLMNSEIADRLFVSERTVESHVSALMRKLGAANRRELAALPGPDRRPSLPAALALAAEARPLVGRQRQLNQLVDLWHQSAAGSGRAVAVLGEAGIGKTRLVAELAAVASKDEATVLLATCREGDVAPYRPLADAMAGDLQSLPEHEAVRRTAGLPALEVLLAGRRPAPGPGDTPWDPEAVHRAIASYLARAAQRGPVLLVVDDLHWASPATGQAVAALLDPAPAAAVMVVLTSRDTAPDLDGDTRDLLARVSRAPAVTVIPLGGLDAAAITELAGIGTDGLWAETGGNPLFALELLAAGPGSSGPTLASLVDRRAARLDEFDRHLLDLAAVAGAEFDARLLALATRSDPPAVVEALERIESAGLVWSLPGQPARWAFVHPVFRRVREDGLGSARRMAFHDSLAAALEDRPSLGAGAADLARHAYAAYPLGDAERALAACPEAGERAAAVHAVDEAVAHFRAALDVASDGAGDETMRCELSTRIGALLHTAGRPEGATALATAAGEARRLGDGRLLGEIAWALSHFGSGLMGMPSALITGLVDDALDLVDSTADVAARARLLGLRASQLAFAGDTARARSVSDYALGLARALDDPVVVGEVLLTRRLAVFTPTTLDLRLQTASEMAALGDTYRWPTLALLGRLGLASCRREQGDLSSSFRALDEAVALMDGTPPAWVTLLVTAMSANRHLLAGDLGASERVIGELQALRVTAGAGLGAVIEPATWAEPHLLAVRHCQGRLAELRDDAGRYGALGAAAAAVRTCALAHAGQLDEARLALDLGAKEAFRSFPEDLTWLTAMVALAEAAAMTGHVEAAGALGHLLRPYAGRLDNYGDGSLSSVDLALAQVALLAAPAGEAEARAITAVTSCRQAGAPILLGRSLVCLAAARRGGARGGTATLVGEALEIAGRTGALLIEQDAARYELL